MKDKAVVILSGGLDSTVLLYDYVKALGAENVAAITFDYGQRHNKEILCAEKTTKKLGVMHKVIDMAAIGSQLFTSALMDKDAVLPTGKYADENLQSTVVPNRNMIMVSLATAYAISFNATMVAYGAHSGDHSNYPDCRPEFIEKLRSVLAVCHFDPIALETPYAHASKADIVSIGLELNVPFEDTWSCYDGGEYPCGECTTCNDRLEAFDANDANDPLIYKKKAIEKVVVEEKKVEEKKIEDKKIVEKKAEVK
ncbi:MAG: 7-cyano-7-deazaguanine synthase QueC [Cetobacterium sp.]